MPSSIRQGACSLVAAFFFSGIASAQTLATSARQLEPGTWKVLGYYQGFQSDELDFDVASGGPCAGAGSSNPAFPCGSSGKVTAKADGGAAVAKLLVQPWDRAQYYVYGGLGDLTLRLPNGNVLTGEGRGRLVGAGVRGLLMPDTVVSPAVAIDASAGWQQYRFGEVRPAATAAAGQIDQKLDMYQYQVALEASHRFELSDPKVALEPYGGVKWLRTQSYLKDQRADGGGSRIGGMKDVFSPFAGLMVPVLEHETLFAEASFVDGVRYAAGLVVRFPHGEPRR